MTIYTDNFKKQLHKKIDKLQGKHSLKMDKLREEFSLKLKKLYEKRPDFNKEQEEWIKELTDIIGKFGNGWVDNTIDTALEISDEAVSTQWLLGLELHRGRLASMFLNKQFCPKCDPRVQKIYDNEVNRTEKLQIKEE